MQIRVKKRYHTFVLSLFMSSIMSCIMSFAITLFAIGLVEGFAFIWLKAWGQAFATAFPIVQIVFPLVRRIIDRVFVFY
ncbi:MAG: DUF2798 domain-containing protein [Proteobacteria bacterium]|nr:DUF2798 domain-containing protein [Pseudomonadota bacterium]